MKNDEERFCGERGTNVLTKPALFDCAASSSSTMSVNVRLRHPKGVNTIKVDLEAPVSELQQAIFSYTEIPPSQQDSKS